MSASLPPPPYRPRTIQPPPKLPAAPPPSTQGPAKTFSIIRRKPTDFGRRICFYGPGGSGKSTLVKNRGDVVFIDLNHGLNALGADVIDGVTSFGDLRDAIRQSASLIPEGGALAVDTITECDMLMVEYLKFTHKKKSIKELSYDRFSSSVEAFRLILSDLEAVTRTKRDVILIAHESSMSYKNAVGEDYKQISPKLTHSANDSCRDELVNWCDHVIRVALADAQVMTQTNDKGKVVGGKAINASTERYLTTDGTQSIIAKSRPISVEGTNYRLPSLISFAGADDATFWDGLKDPRIYIQGIA